MTPRLARWTFAGALAITMLHAQSPVREAYATVPGARIFYRDTGGSGVPVILLHAATGSSRVWDYQIPAFVAAGYRVIAFDRRGWGRTEINSAEPQPWHRRSRRPARLARPVASRSRARNRHGRRRFRGARFRFVVPEARAQPGDRQLHRRGAGRRLSRTGATAFVRRNSPNCRRIFASWVRPIAPVMPRAPRVGWSWKRSAGRRGPRASAAATQPHQFCHARKHPHANSAADRRRRSLRAPADPAAFRGADQRLRDIGHPRSRALRLLGAARGFQSRGFEIPGQTLS